VICSNKKEKSPAIILLMKLRGRARGKSNMSGGNDKRKYIKQLLTEMDGFGTNSNVIVLAQYRADVLIKH
jgi:cell division protease FtsH